MTMEEKIELFETELEYIRHDDIRNFVRSAIEGFPDYFFEVPASSSGKFHSALESGFGGLVYHTKSVAKVANYLVNLEQYKNKLEERDGDYIIAACICHDCLKHGLDNKTGYSVFEHPLLARQYIESVDGLPDEQRSIIANAIESHSGEWNTSKRSKVILAKPITLIQELVHISDYIASRSDIHIIFDEEEAKPHLPNPNEYIMTFGKYKGEKLSDVFRAHKDYLDWCKENVKREPLMTLVATLEKEQEDEKL